MSLLLMEGVELFSPFVATGKFMLISMFLSFDPLAVFLLDAELLLRCWRSIDLFRIAKGSLTGEGVAALS